MIYAAVKNYERALYFLEIVITTPAMTVSHIMLEAYKKYILISLILNGKVSRLYFRSECLHCFINCSYSQITTVPKHTSQVLGRFIRPLSQPYTELATAYQTSNYEEVRGCINRHTETLNR